LEYGAKSVEEPSMGVYLFLVFFFKAKDELDRDCSAFRTFYFHGWCYGYLSGVFVDMGCYWAVSDFVLCEKI
jgi:hypothetical protein